MDIYPAEIFLLVFYKQGTIHYAMKPDVKYLLLAVRKHPKVKNTLSDCSGLMTFPGFYDRIWMIFWQQSIHLFVHMKTLKPRNSF